MLPRELAPRFVLDATQLFYETDPLTREIFAMGEYIQGRLVAEVARPVVDLNRDPQERAPEVADGVIKHVSGYGHQIWEREGHPTDDEVERLLDRYHRPFHESLARTAKRGKVRIGIDCHSIAPIGPPEGSDAGKVRPLFTVSNHGDENGEGDEITAPASYIKSMVKAIEKEFGGDELAQERELCQVNPVGSGGYILERHGYGNTPWLQFSVNQLIYMDPSEGQEEIPDSDRERVAAVRNRLLRVLAYFCKAVDR